jgi:hypothetical protein
MNIGPIRDGYGDMGICNVACVSRRGHVHTAKVYFSWQKVKSDELLRHYTMGILFTYSNEGRADMHLV